MCVQKAKCGGGGPDAAVELVRAAHAGLLGRRLPRQKRALAVSRRPASTSGEDFRGVDLPPVLTGPLGQTITHTTITGSPHHYYTTLGSDRTSLPGHYEC